MGAACGLNALVVTPAICMPESNVASCKQYLHQQSDQALGSGLWVIILPFRCQLGRSVLAQHIAIVGWAAKCQLIGRLSAPLRFASSASNAQLQSLGSIATCQLSLTLSWICSFVHQNWPQPHHQQLQGALISLSFARCYMSL